MKKTQFHSKRSEQSVVFDSPAQYHAVSLSGGKDSTCMLLMMIEKQMPIDVVLFADTGMEFPEMYGHLEQLEKHLQRERGLSITILRHPQGFEYLMFEEPKQKAASIANRKQMGVPLCGNGWPGIRVRWCTGQLKTHLMEWGITESEALQHCYARGFRIGNLYEIYHRASCWCCPFQRIGELRKLRRHHPELWQQLMDMDNRALAQFGQTPLGRFKENWTVDQLDKRFAKEDLLFGGDE